jgi:acetyl-CoA carboxylase biotin carboxyl carrier protein
LKERRSYKEKAKEGSKGFLKENTITKGNYMSIKKIKELVDLMKDNDLIEVELEQEGLKVKLVKNRDGGVERLEVQPKTVLHAAPAGESEASQQSQSNKNLKEITSPMVGTFYMASSPEAEPYVNVGDTIQKGDVICIIEAMKLMNEVKAEFGGRIVEILVENAESVEFGQAIYLVEPL